MCGIVGYIGKQEAYPILIKGLKRLEYRGYDSAGVALVSPEGKLEVYKAKGKVANLENRTNNADHRGRIGIAHTRWATHGEPCEKNAHPHVSESGRLALVHNGIIENYAVLKQQLQEKGYTFRSDTDTEVIVQLMDYFQQTYGLDLAEAARAALQQVVGAYAIAVIDRTQPDRLIAARKSSPLVIGMGEEEFYLASDATPLVEHTHRMVYLQDNEIAILQPGKPLKVVNLQNEEQPTRIKEVDIRIGQLEKGGYEHFMLKEIFEQPESINDCMRGRVDCTTLQVILSAVNEHREKLLKAKRFVFVACGTSWHAALIGKQLIETLCRIPAEVEYASEFRYRNPVITEEDVVIALSQSGETADTLAAIELARKHGAFVYGICNVIGSSIPRNTDTGSYIHVGPEIGVASTKAFTGQVTVLVMLALTLGKAKGSLRETTYTSLVKGLTEIPDKIRHILQENGHIKELSQTFRYAHNFLYLGRGFSYPVALEGALKLKEISYIHAEGYPAAEMKHGPIALVDTEMPVVVIATRNAMYEKVVNNIQEIKARKGYIIALVNPNDILIRKLADACIEIPETNECLEPLLTCIPLQLLAYHIAVCKGKDVDQPRNLAKSVTVE